MEIKNSFFSYLARLFKCIDILPNVTSFIQDGYCNYKNVTPTAKMTGFVNVTSGDLDALKVALAKHGPVSVAMDASHKSLSFYANGVYYEPKCGRYLTVPYTKLDFYFTL